RGGYAPAQISRHDVIHARVRGGGRSDGVGAGGGAGDANAVFAPLVVRGAAVDENRKRDGAACAVGRAGRIAQDGRRDAAVGDARGYGGKIVVWIDVVLCAQNVGRIDESRS